MTGPKHEPKTQPARDGKATPLVRGKTASGRSVSKPNELRPIVCNRGTQSCGSESSPARGYASARNGTWNFCRSWSRRRTTCVISFRSSNRRYPRHSPRLGKRLTGAYVPWPGDEAPAKSRKLHVKSETCLRGAAGRKADVRCGEDVKIAATVKGQNAG